MTTQIEKALKPCPFCGGKARLWSGDWANNDHGVVCADCEVTVDPAYLNSIESESSEEYAARAWNTRALEAPHDDEVKNNAFAEFGKGRLVVVTGKYGGKPAVFIEDNCKSGEVGSNVLPEDRVPTDRLLPPAIVLMFPTDEQAKIVSDALVTPAPTLPVTAQGQQGWMTMESAPKDGTEILAWRHDAGCFLIRWDAPENFLTETECIELGDSACEYSWIIADFVQGGRLEGDEIPTLWKSLDAPPAHLQSQKQAGGE